MLYKELTALALLLTAHALPTQSQTEVVVKRDNLELPFFYPTVATKSFPVTATDSLVEPTTEQLIQIARDALIKEFNLNKSDFVITQHHTDTEGVTHVYGVRTIGGVPVDNNNCAVHLKGESVVSLSSSFNGGVQKRADAVKPAVAKVSLEEAVKIASKEYGVPRDSFPAKLVYVQLSDGTIAYAHQFQLKNAEVTKWLQVTVDASNGKLVQVVDYVSSATLTGLPFPKNDPSEGFTDAVDPAYVASSPLGWNADSNSNYTDTQGNNVISGIRGKTVEGGAELNFTTQFKPEEQPETTDNQKASIVNNFFVSNLIHDVTYQYGFTEEAGNFQNSNFGKGGKENDRVVINNQASGINNANFATPPDGQSGVMNMYLWDKTTPKRDGSLDNTVPIHEYCHGISNRLTGGSAQGNCLRATESRGMGEGWGDTLAMFLTRKATDTRNTTWVLAPYATNNTIKGLRKQPYSTDLTINTYTYNSIKGLTSVHNIGEIWATTLNEVYWNLVDKHGYSSNFYDANQIKGNIIALKLLINGMKLQPCNPSFFQARDAILKADELYYEGSNRCLLWKAFAKRGMGPNAVNDGYVNGFEVPADCVEQQ